jgi:hypothetical protein
LALVENDGESHCPIALAKRDSRSNDVIPPEAMPVVTVIEPEQYGQLLVVDA